MSGKGTSYGLAVDDGAVGGGRYGGLLVWGRDFRHCVYMYLKRSRDPSSFWTAFFNPNGSSQMPKVWGDMESNSGVFSKKIPQVHQS